MDPSAIGASLQAAVRATADRDKLPLGPRAASNASKASAAASPLADFMSAELLNPCGATGNRTPDLLDANESRYQLRHSP
jgi:hypothetical protein